jgi:two-component system, cell cycle sensor histidine kinase and response regulator CckA
MPSSTEPPTIEPGRSRYEAARLRLARLRVEGGSSLRPVFQESSRLAVTTLGVERVSIWMFVEGRSAIRCFELYESGGDEHSEGSVLHRHDYPAYFQALEAQRVIAADDAWTHEATRDLRAGYLEPLDIRSMLDAPIFQGGEVVGVVCHETVGHAHHWSAEDVAFAGTVADTLALQVEAAARRDAESALHAHEEYVAEIRKMEALGRLSAGVAHDFRNILSVVLGHARLIESEESASPRVLEQAARIVAAADRGVELTRELLAFGREDTGEKPQAVRVPEVIEKFREVLAQSVGRRITLELAPATTPGWALISPPRLERILLNLVNNARDAMPQGGTIRIEVSERRVPDGAGSPGVYVVVDITDTGVGMDAATQRRIFEPFFTTKGPGANSGLGLSVVYRIVEACGGFLHVESAPGKGTTISVYLPRVSSHG